MFFQCMYLVVVTNAPSAAFIATVQQTTNGTWRNTIASRPAAINARTATSRWTRIEPCMGISELLIRKTQVRIIVLLNSAYIIHLKI